MSLNALELVYSFESAIVLRVASYRVTEDHDHIKDFYIFSLSMVLLDVLVSKFLGFELQVETRTL